MKLAFYILIAVIVIFFGVTFAFHNKQSVDVSYYFGMSWSGPLALALLAAAAFGVAIGFLASLRTLLRLQRQLVTARREIRQVEQEVQNLRALPVKMLSKEALRCSS